MRMSNQLLYGRHIYTRIDPVYIQSLNSVKEALLLNDQVYCNNVYTEATVADLLSDLESYHKENESEHVHILERLRVMIPTGCKKKVYHHFFEAIMSVIKNVADCPAFCAVESKGKCSYMDVYISERRYYPNGAEQTEYYTSDWYRNPKTGRRCAFDVPGAVLEHKKGDVRSRKVTKFSGKKNVLRLTRGEFIELKRNLVHAINKFCDDNVLNPRVLLLKHIDYDKVSISDKRLRIHSACFNAYISKIEQEITKCYRYMKNAGIDDIRNVIDHFCTAFFKRSGDGFSGTYKSESKKFSWRVDLSDSVNRLIQNLELMFMEFDRQFRNMITDRYISIAM